jgi:hypothetical protein
MMLRTVPAIRRCGYLAIAIALASVTVGLSETTANAAPDPIMVARMAGPDGSFGAPGEVQRTVERPHHDDDDGAPTPQYYTANCPALRALWRDTLLAQLAMTFDFDNIHSSITSMALAFCLSPNYIHGITSDDIGILEDSVNLPYVIRFIKQSNNSAILAFQVKPEKAGDKSNWPTPAICIDAIRLDEQAERDGYKLKSRFVPPTSHAYFQTSRAGPRWQKLYMYFNHSGCLTSLTTFYCNENKPNC